MLDVGCGPSSILRRLPPIERSVGIEANPPALAESRRNRIHDEYIEGDARRVELPPASFDAVMMIDLLEHLEPADGLALLGKAQRLARKKVIVFTPNGFVRQDEYGGNPLQVHRSGWTVEDLRGRGYRLYGIGGLKALRGDLAIPRRPRVVTRPLANLTQPAVYRHPKHAFHLLAVKTLSSEEGG